MKFRPCIDIHNGKVKQLVGGSLRDAGDKAQENYVSDKNASYYAELYSRDHLDGGHIIILNGKDSEYYDSDCKQAELALRAFPGGMQIGGGMNDINSPKFLEMGASHIIFTSFIFNDGHVNYDNLNKLVKAIGREHIVLDLSCRKRGEQYYIVTDRWQKFTETKVERETLDKLANYCDEFLLHAVDVEGKASGIETELVEFLGEWDGIPVTYAGGISSYEDIETMREKGHNRVDFTVGSSLDLFGGDLKYKKIIEVTK